MLKLAFSLGLGIALVGCRSVNAIHPQVLEHSDGGLASVASSPDCWLDAVRALDMDASATADACQWMTADHQKILALELARCHVKDLGRSLFDEGSTGFSVCSAGNYQEHLSSCLTQMTPSGETAYTHFLTYINQLCARLLREVVIANYYETSVQLAKTSAAVEKQLQEMLSHQQELWKVWNDREEESARLHDRFKTEVYQERIRLVSESSLLQSQFQVQREEWSEQQERAQLKQRLEMEEQQELLTRQREELARLSETVVHTNQAIRPWSMSLDSLSFYMQRSYFALQWSLHALGSTLAIWFFTLPRCLRWLRRYMACWVIFVGLVEIGFIVGDDELLTKEGLEAVFSDLRKLLLLLQVVTYIPGALLSCCCRRRQDQPPTVIVPKNESSSANSNSSARSPKEESQDKALARLHAYEEHWKAILEHQCRLRPAALPVVALQAHEDSIEGPRFQDSLPSTINSRRPFQSQPLPYGGASSFPSEISGHLFARPPPIQHQTSSGKTPSGAGVNLSSIFTVSPELANTAGLDASLFNYPISGDFLAQRERAAPSESAGESTRHDFQSIDVAQKEETYDSSTWSLRAEREDCASGSRKRSHALIGNNEESRTEVSEDDEERASKRRLSPDQPSPLPLAELGEA